MMTRALKDFLTPTQVAKELGVPLPTIYSWVQLGRLPSTKLGGQLRINPDDLSHVIKEYQPRKR